MDAETVLLPVVVEDAACSWLGEVDCHCDVKQGGEEQGGVEHITCLGVVGVACAGFAHNLDALGFWWVLLIVATDDSGGGGEQRNGE